MAEATQPTYLESEGKIVVIHSLGTHGRGKNVCSLSRCTSNRPGNLEVTSDLGRDANATTSIEPPPTHLTTADFRYATLIAAVSPDPRSLTRRPNEGEGRARVFITAFGETPPSSSQDHTKKRDSKG